MNLLEQAEKKEAPSRKYLHQFGMWASLWGLSFVMIGISGPQPTLDGDTHQKVVLGCIRMQTMIHGKQTIKQYSSMASAFVSCLQVPPLSSYPDFALG